MYWWVWLWFYKESPFWCFPRTSMISTDPLIEHFECLMALCKWVFALKLEKGLFEFYIASAFCHTGKSSWIVHLLSLKCLLFLFLGNWILSHGIISWWIRWHEGQYNQPYFCRFGSQRSRAAVLPHCHRWAVVQHWWAVRSARVCVHAAGRWPLWKSCVRCGVVCSKRLLNCDFISALLQVRCTVRINPLCLLGPNRADIYPPARDLPPTPNLHPGYREAAECSLLLLALLLGFHKGAWHVRLAGGFLTVQTSLNFGCFWFLQMLVFYTILEF